MTPNTGTPLIVSSQSWRRLASNLVVALAVIAPFAYLGMLLAVVVHEAVGHGLAAIMLGGQFLGFTMDFAGMGWAYTTLPAGSPAWKSIVELAAGVAATTISGLVCLQAAVRVRQPVFSMVLLLTSLNLLLEGTPYLFWNAVNPVPPGDIGKIIATAGLSWLRPVLILAGGVLMFGFIASITMMLFRRLEAWLVVGGRLEGRQRLAALLLIAAMLGSAWFIFDWDLLAPGLGQVPNWTGALAAIIAAASLYWVRFRPMQFCPTRRAIIFAVLFGYGSVGIVVFLVGSCLCPR